MLFVVVPLLAHFRLHNVSIRQPETLALLLPAAAIGAGAGWVAGKSRPVVRVALLSLLSIAATDLLFDLSGWRWAVPALTPGVVWLLREHYSTIAIVSLGVFAVTVPFRAALGGPTWGRFERAGAATGPGPIPIVYLVLDEHAAPRAFPADIPEAVDARNRITAFYRNYGFRLYEYAYSRHVWTVQSMVATMVRRPADAAGTVISAVDAHQGTLRDNTLFRWAAARGYRIHVTQSSYLDFCSALTSIITSCRTYQANSAASLQMQAMGFLPRVRLTYAYFLLTESEVFKAAQGLSRRIQRRLGGDDDPGTSLAGWQARAHGSTTMAELARVQRLVEGGLEGTFVFAHLLLPHFPYELDRDCRERSALSRRLGPGWKDGTWGNTEASLRLRWKLYSEQAICLYRQLDSLMVVMDSVTRETGAIVVIHGDHGSRIALTRPDPWWGYRLSPRDILAHFGTLLAIRGPGFTPGVDRSLVAVHDFVAPALMGTYHREADATDAVPVVVLEYYRIGRQPVIPLWAPSLAPARSGRDDSLHTSAAGGSTN